MSYNLRLKPYKPIVCQDGFSMSVQAGPGSYCRPRRSLIGTEHYTEVEVGFPSQEESLITQYAEQPDDLTGTVYGWVPSTTVALVCAKHGGVVSGELPPGVPLFAAEQCSPH